MTKKLTKNILLTIIFQIFILSSFIIVNAADDVSIKIISPQDNALITENEFTITGTATGVSEVEINDKTVNVNPDGSFTGPTLVAPGHAKKNNIIDDDDHIIMNFPGSTTITVEAKEETETVTVYCYQVFVKSDLLMKNPFYGIDWHLQDWNNDVLVQCPFSEWTEEKLDQGHRQRYENSIDEWRYFKDFFSCFSYSWTKYYSDVISTTTTQMTIHTLPAINDKIQPMVLVFKNCYFGNCFLEYYDLTFDLSQCKVNGQTLKMLYGEWDSFGNSDWMPNAFYIVLTDYEADKDIEIQVTEMPTYEVAEEGASSISSFRHFSFSEIDLLKLRVEILDGSDFSIGDTIEANDIEKLISEGRRVRTAVADGVTRLLLRFDGSGTAEFSVDDLVDGSVSSIDNQQIFDTSVSVQSVSTTDGEKIFAIYKVPDNEDLSEREITVNIKYTPSSGSVEDLSQKITLVRPPVVLIHGLWAGPGTWQNSQFEYFLSQEISNIFIYDVDYSLTNGSYFYINLPKVADQIETVIKNKRQYSNIAITQVDVIAHSMGGVLSRLFSQKAYYKKKDNFKEGYINKLVTIDTPHYGAFLADVLAITRDNLSPLAREILEELLEVAKMPIDRGAIDDLRVTHLKITDPLKPCPIPSFTIVGDFTSQIGVDLAFLPSPLNCPFLILNLFGVDTNFNLPEHDIIVEGNSQRGGFSGNTTETYSHIHINFGLHPVLGIWGAVENPEVKEKIIFLLNNDINSGNFDNFN